MRKKDRPATKRDLRRLEERLTARLGGALAVLMIGLVITTIVAKRNPARGGRLAESRSKLAHTIPEVEAHHHGASH